MAKKGIEFFVNDKVYQGNGLKEINGMNFRGCLTMLALIYIFLIVIIARGEPQPYNMLVFTIINVIAYGISSAVYLRKKDSKYYKYFMIAAFYVTYCYLIFNNNDAVVCMLVVPPTVMMILYHDVVFSAICGGATFIINLIFVIIQAVNSGGDIMISRDGGFQMLMLTLFLIASISATSFYADSYRKNTLYTQMLENKSEQLTELTEQTIETLASAIDAKDHYTEGHSRRVSRYAVKIAKQMGIDGEELDIIKYSALLHDVGKISVPDRVLNKNTRLDDEEFKEMKGHTVSGGDILSMISTIPGISGSAKYHHEKFDGSGYPNGLKGDEIPLSARIIALADAYDAMTSDRVYRKKLDDDYVENEIRKFSGTQFDPEVVKAFFTYLEENGELKEE